MKNVNVVLSLSIVAGLALSGCSSTKTALERHEQYQEEYAEYENKRIERENERLESALGNVPDWIVEPPKADSTGMYAIGIGESKKISIAINKSTLKAEFGLAKVYKQEISGSERQFEQDNGGESVSEQYTALIDKLVEHVSVVGYEVVEQELVVQNGKYTSYMLLKLPYDQFNKVLQEQRQQEKDDTIVAAFNDLEKRLDKRRAQRQEEDTLAHKRQLESTKQAGDQEARAKSLEIERLKVESAATAAPSRTSVNK